MATKSIGYVVELVGDAQVRSVDGVIRVLSIGDQINDGDVLTTGINTQIVLEFIDGQRLQLGEYTEILLDDSVFAGLNAYPDDRADQLAELQSLLVEGIDPAELEATAAGAPSDRADGLHQASDYSRDGAEGIVETRVTPFNIGQRGFGNEDPLVANLSLAPEPPQDNPALSSAFPVAGSGAFITIDNITADDIINAMEASGSTNVTGFVWGDAAPGDPISMTLNGNLYNAAVSAGNTFSIPVDSNDLVMDTSFDVTVTGIDANGNPFSATTTSTHTIDTAAIISSDSQVLTETDAPLTSTGTLTSIDIDSPDNTFTPSGTNGAIGNFSIDAAGVWNFTANSAYDSLNVGDSVNETFNVTSVDGTPGTVQITIIGSNDGATVSSDAQILTETDAPLTSNGTLTSSDVDNADNAFTPATLVGTIGTLAIDAAGVWNFTANSAFDSLNVGDSVNETFTVTSVDGTPSTVQITINGTNDAATVSSESQTLSETDAPITASGTLTSTDVDNIDNAFTPATLVGTIGTLAIDAAGVWNFTANSAFDSLNVGDSVNETFTVASVDGTPSSVQITINGTNDAATVSSDSQTLSETDAPITASGTLTSTDVDNIDNAFTPASIVGTIGSLTIDPAGAWNFTANSAFDSLNVGDSVNETFNVANVDGIPSTVQITINGTNDAATVNSESQTLAETDLPVTASGTLTSTDVDNADNAFTPATIVGSIGTLTIDAAGAWNFTASS
ncbi:MAG TPA: retention module-containing protein, partial [Gammaproteobacteria bacterium]|nr:retention module-containing protein [Gammaproteobacteria bacterium]